MPQRRNLDTFHRLMDKFSSSVLTHLIDKKLERRSREALPADVLALLKAPEAPKMNWNDNWLIILLMNWIIWLLLLLLFLAFPFFFVEFLPFYHYFRLQDVSEILLNHNHISLALIKIMQSFWK